MMKQIRVLVVLLTMCCGYLFAQDTPSSIRLVGQIVSDQSEQQIAGATITLANQNLSTTTNQNGEFTLLYIEPGDEELIIEAEGYQAAIELIQILPDQTNDLGKLRLLPDMAKEVKEEVLLNLLDQDLKDDEGRTQEQASSASSDQDVFNSMSSWSWSTARYRQRGYGNKYEQNYIEGLPFNSAERGQFNFSAMGGLNDASRYKETVNPLEATNFSFGTLGKSTNYLMTASNYAQGWKVSAAGTNRNYKAAVRASYSSGPLKNGWSFMGQLAFRFSPYIDKKGIIGEGINYYSLGYFFSAEKKWGDQHRLSIITFGAPTLRGQSAAVTQEVYDLTNQYNKNQWGWNNYNPYWGYQDGKVRNSREVKSYDPTLILGYDFKIDEQRKLHVAAGYHYSMYSNSAISFYNAPDPRPDYYRNLPSNMLDGQLTSNGQLISHDINERDMSANRDPQYYNGQYVGYSMDYDAFKTLTDLWTSRDDKTTQIDWQALYSANYAQNLLDPNGSARYIVERRHNDIQEAVAAATYQDTHVDHLKITTGLELKQSQGIHFKTMDDLLGGNQWLDVDAFSERDIRELATNIGMTQAQIEYVKQNDLKYWNEHNFQAQGIKTGDKFGYDYRINMSTAKIWAQNEWNWQNIDLYYGLQLTYTNMQRTTNMINGRAVYLANIAAQSDPELAKRYLGADNDYFTIRQGKCPTRLEGDWHHFVDPSFKIGFNYKINGRNHIKFNALAETRAPLARDAYISPRVHDRAIGVIYTHDHASNLVDYYAASEKVIGGDLSYEFNYPIVRGRLTAYYTRLWNGSELNGYYDDEARTFVNQAITGLNRRHAGVEAAIAVKLGTYFTLTGAASISDQRYMSNAYSISSAENGMALDTYLDKETGKDVQLYELCDSVLMKGLRVSNGPQLNASLKLSFFHPKMWFADITVSYYDWNYLSVAPSRRMQGLFTGVRADGTTVNGSYAKVYTTHDNYIDVRQHDREGNILTDKYGIPLLEKPYNYLSDQESLVSNNIWNRFLIDMSVGKLIYLPQRQSLSINLSVTNLTNNVHFKTGGYQQARLPRSTRQGVDDKENSTINSNIWKFPSKYYYAWGMNFYLTVTYKF
ncbi:MAG: carboxypeptidase-like regulatory domain-containing protein [Paludibacteraceae bacterium]|nr:carboxypeptidase-like regulatory domain-containing protein [Paludibacteraceae bacterium]